MKFAYKPKGICPSEISFNINDENVITDVQFTGGCSGNLQAIPRLIDGWKAEEIINKCSGITCGSRSTSCSDQLTQALKAAISDKK